MKKLCVLFVAVLLLALAPAGFAQPAKANAPKAEAPSSASMLNINTASVKELEALPGIGKVAAERIVAYRTEKGKFTSVEGLLKVKGVGDKTLEKIRSRIAVN